VLGLAHGFLVQRWLDAEPSSIGRGRLLAQLADYLDFRTRQFTTDQCGASLARLFEMALINVNEAFGQPARDRLAALLGDPARFSVRPVETDNRLQRWEWLAVGDRLFKADALDHCAAHDLIGCQDIAWDIAGAAVEFELSPAERQWLTCRIGADPELVAVLTPCYLAFQIGLWTFARNGSPQESARIDGLTKVYRQRLLGLLDDVSAHRSGREPAPLA
jgi:hypothetical protein